MESNRGLPQRWKVLEVGITDHFLLKLQHSVTEGIRVLRLHKPQDQDRRTASLPHDEVPLAIVEGGIAGLVHEEPGSPWEWFLHRRSLSCPCTVQQHFTSEWFQHNAGGQSRQPVSRGDSSHLLGDRGDTSPYFGERSPRLGQSFPYSGKSTPKVGESLP
jgi:hypothetical protein